MHGERREGEREEREREGFRNFFFFFLRPVCVFFPPHPPCPPLPLQYACLSHARAHSLGQ